MNPKNVAEILFKLFANEESTLVTLQEYDLAEKIRLILLSGVAFEDTTVEVCNETLVKNLLREGCTRV